MTSPGPPLICAGLLALAAQGPTATTPANHTIRLHGATAAVDIPLEGMARNDDAVALATRIQGTQKALSAWRRSLDPNSNGGRRLSELAAKLQDESIGDLRDGYNVAATTSGSFPADTKKRVELLQSLIDAITTHSRFQDRVVTHISTAVAGATIHYRQYQSQPDAWSTYADGEVMDIGGYYFRVSNRQGVRFQELYVVLDNPSTHQLAP